MFDCTLGIERLRHHLLKGNIGVTGTSQDKPEIWDLVTQACCRDYRNKSIPGRSEGGRSSSAQAVYRDLRDHAQSVTENHKLGYMIQGIY